MSKLPEDPEARAREIARLRAISELDLPAMRGDETLSDIVREAAHELGMPIGLVSIVLDQAQMFLASHGLDGWIATAGGTPVEWAFCRFAVQDRKPFVVENAYEHPRVRDNPLVTQDGVRSYMGVPLLTGDGQALGTLCVLGGEPHAFSDEDLARLSELAARVVSRIQARVPRAD